MQPIEIYKNPKKKNDGSTKFQYFVNYSEVAQVETLR